MIPKYAYHLTHTKKRTPPFSILLFVFLLLLFFALLRFFLLFLIFSLSKKPRGTRFFSLSFFLALALFCSFSLSIVLSLFPSPSLLQACKKVYHQPRQPACSGWMIEHHGRVQESNVCPLAPQPSAYHEIMISVHTYAHTYSRATWPFSFDGLLLAGLFSINSQRQFSRASFYLTKKSFATALYVV